MKSEVSYGIIPVSSDKTQVLMMLQRNGEFWGFPKGHPQGTENEKQAAERELFEEVGIQVKEYLDISPLKQHYQFQRGDETVDKTVYFFTAIVIGKLSISKNEVIEAKWVPVEDAAVLMTYEAGKKTVEELRRKLK